MNEPRDRVEPPLSTNNQVLFRLLASLDTVDICYYTFVIRQLVHSYYGLLGLTFMKA